MDNNEERRRQYRERKAAGICIRCGKAPARPGKTRCQRCALDGRGYYLIGYERKKENGFCVTCGKPLSSDSEYVLCESCRESNNAFTKKYLAKRKSEGRCVRCGRKTDGHTICEWCLAKKRASRCTC